MYRKVSWLLIAIAIIGATASCGGNNAGEGNFASNGPKAPYARFNDSPISCVTPSGWIGEWLERQRSGMTGHPEALSYPYDSELWYGDDIARAEGGYDSDWWRYEQTAYYTDGLLNLAYLLDDKDLISKAEKGIIYTIENADEGGRLPHTTFGSAEMWPMSVFFRALKSYARYHGMEQEIAELLTRHYLTYSPENLGQWRNIMSIEGMMWAYGYTHERKLLDIAEEAWNAGTFWDLTPEACAADKTPSMHGVTFSEELKLPMLLYEVTGKEHYRKLALHAWETMARDNMLPDGVQTSAEHLMGNADIRLSHETCDITDITWTLGYFLETTGDGRWGDLIERAVFNAAPGAVTKDFKSLQYFSSVNQVIATGESNHNDFYHGSTWMAYRPTHQTECCAGNVHRIMPNYVSRMWLRGDNDEIVAALYGPSEYTAMVGGKKVRIIEKTSYPFSESIDFTVKTEGKTTFPLALRIPSWCENALVSINGKDCELTVEDGFARIGREWKNGDRVRLHLPMEARMRVLENGENGAYVERGPLLYAFAVPQKAVADTVTYGNMNGKVPGNPDFKCWSITPDGDWNYALCTTPETFASDAQVTEKKPGGYPFDLGAVYTNIRVPVRKINWELDDGRFTPALPSTVETLGEETEYISLVPYGATELRISVFPLVK